MPRRARSIAVKFPVFVLALLLVVIWGLASYFNIALKRDLERLLSVQQFSTVSVIAASIEQEIRLRLRTLDERPKRSASATCSASHSRLMRSCTRIWRSRRCSTVVFSCWTPPGFVSPTPRAWRAGSG